MVGFAILNCKEREIESRLAKWRVRVRVKRGRKLLRTQERPSFSMELLATAAQVLLGKRNALPGVVALSLPVSQRSKLGFSGSFIYGEGNIGVIQIM